MSEWLRQTWNLLGFVCADSNPAVVVSFCFFSPFAFFLLIIIIPGKNKVQVMWIVVMVTYSQTLIRKSIYSGYICLLSFQTSFNIYVAKHQSLCTSHLQPFWDKRYFIPKYHISSIEYTDLSNMLVLSLNDIIL